LKAKNKATPFLIRPDPLPEKLQKRPRFHRHTDTRVGRLFRVTAQIGGGHAGCEFAALRSGVMVMEDITKSNFFDSSADAQRALGAVRRR
jgi:hypothetical protein